TNDAPVIDLDANNSHNVMSKQAISGLFNTGVDNNGAALALGVTDSHYTMLSGPTGNSVTSTTSQISGSWFANDGDSVWVGSTGTQPTGLYQYQTSFTLQAGADPSSVQISFDIGADNFLRDILVNGVSTGISSALGYRTLTHVDLNGVTAAFQSGNNVITFVVENRDAGYPTNSGPTGLRIDNITGTVEVISGSNSTNLTGYVTDYIEGTPVSIADSDVSIADADNTTIQSATITLTNAQAGDLLQVENLPAGITASSYNAVTGVLTLTGSATLAAYQTAIQAVKFNSTSDTPNSTIDRVITVVVNDGQANSNVATTTVHVIPVNDSPVLDLDQDNSSATGTSYAATYTENGTGVAIAGNDVQITDVDSTEIKSAVIHLTNAQSGDYLAAGTLPTGLVVSQYDPINGIITISGTASLAIYQTAIAAIKFASTSDNPTNITRTIEVTVNDGSSNSNVAVSSITVIPVNDAPVNTVPATQITNEDTNKAITG
ncbi:hypothetical protein LIN78_17940, partial [Leeia sp. TBRC 13508]